MVGIVPRIAPLLARRGRRSAPDLYALAIASGTWTSHGIITTPTTGNRYRVFSSVEDGATMDVTEGTPASLGGGVFALMFGGGGWTAGNAGAGGANGGGGAGAFACTRLQATAPTGIAIEAGDNSTASVTVGGLTFVSAGRGGLGQVQDSAGAQGSTSESFPDPSCPVVAAAIMSGGGGGGPSAAGGGTLGGAAGVEAGTWDTTLAGAVGGGGGEGGVSAGGGGGSRAIAPGIDGSADDGGAGGAGMTVSNCDVICQTVGMGALDGPELLLQVLGVAVTATCGGGGGASSVNPGAGGGGAGSGSTTDTGESTTVPGCGGGGGVAQLAPSQGAPGRVILAVRV